MTDGTVEFDYDYVVIGGGSGGIASAKRAATLYNAKVAGKFKSVPARKVLPSIVSIHACDLQIQYHPI